VAVAGTPPSSASSADGLGFGSGPPPPHGQSSLQGAGASGPPPPSEAQSAAHGGVQAAAPPPAQAQSAGQGAGDANRPPSPPEGQSAGHAREQLEGGGVPPASETAAGMVSEPDRDTQVEVAPQVAVDPALDAPYQASRRDPVPAPLGATGAAALAAGLGFGLCRRPGRRVAPAPAWARPPTSHKRRNRR
jgi:hypothetical protein